MHAHSLSLLSNTTFPSSSLLESAFSQYTSALGSSFIHQLCRAQIMLLSPSGSAYLYGGSLSDVTQQVLSHDTYEDRFIGNIVYTPRGDSTRYAGIALLLKKQYTRHKPKHTPRKLRCWWGGVRALEDFCLRSNGGRYMCVPLRVGVASLAACARRVVGICASHMVGTQTYLEWLLTTYLDLFVNSVNMDALFPLSARGVITSKNTSTTKLKETRLRCVQHASWPIHNDTWNQRKRSSSEMCTIQFFVYARKCSKEKY